MDLEVTPEHIARLGKRWKKGILGGLSIEEILEEVKVEDLLAHLKPEQRLAGLKLEERLAGLNPQDLENYLQQLQQPPRPPAKARKK